MSRHSSIERMTIMVCDIIARCDWCKDERANTMTETSAWYVNMLEIVVTKQVQKISDPHNLERSWQSFDLISRFGDIHGFLKPSNFLVSPKQQCIYHSPDDKDSTKIGAIPIACIDFLLSTFSCATLYLLMQYSRTRTVYGRNYNTAKAQSSISVLPNFFRNSENYSLKKNTWFNHRFDFR